MVPRLDTNTIYGIQNGKNGAYLKYYQEDVRDDIEAKPDGVNLIITEPEEGNRVKSYEIFVDHVSQANSRIITLRTHDGRYILWRNLYKTHQHGNREYMGKDVIALYNEGTNQRAHWILTDGTFRTDDGFCLLQNRADTDFCLYSTGQNTLHLWGGGNLPVSRAKPAQHWRFVALGQREHSTITLEEKHDRYQILRDSQAQFIRRTKEEDDE